MEFVGIKFSSWISDHVNKLLYLSFGFFVEFLLCIGSFSTFDWHLRLLFMVPFFLWLFWVSFSFWSWILPLEFRFFLFKILIFNIAFGRNWSQPRVYNNMGDIFFLFHLVLIFQLITIILDFKRPYFFIFFIKVDLEPFNRLILILQII